MKEYSLLELQQGLEEGKWTSVDLVEMYLDRIYKYDSSGPKLNSIGEINPDAYFIAKKLDLERKEKGARSILHGIPIVVKDNINTRDKMHTTAGSLALDDLFAPYDATVISKLKDAGAIIMGKANLSEFAHFMSGGMPSGFSSRRGQVKSPYNEKLDPLGSSTGSAVSVAANLIPASIGTETNGSLMAPAQYNSIVSIKPTLGLISRWGIIPISANQDTAGPMGRTVEDCAVLLDFLWGKDNNDVSTETNPKSSYDFKNAINISVKGMRVGVLAFTNLDYEEEEKKILEDAKGKIVEAGMEAVDLKIELKKLDNYRSLVHEFKHDLDYYLSTVSGKTKMTSLNDIISFNVLDVNKRMPYGQTILISAAKTSGTLMEYEYYAARKLVLEEANEINKILEENNLDAIIAPRRTSYAPIAGNPSIAVPAKALTDLSPKSIFFIGKKWEDEKLIAISYNYEQLTKYRIPPVLDKEQN